MTEQATATEQENALDNAWAKYAERTAALPDDLSPAEYLRACIEIAEELGI